MTKLTAPQYLVGQRLSDFDFELPEELIAQFPLAERTASRLLRIGVDGLADLRFADLPSQLRAGDLLVMNDTRVIKARLRGRKDSGGQVEALIERVLTPTTALALLRSSKSVKEGGHVSIAGGGAGFTVTGRQGDLFALSFEGPVRETLERFGRVPLPPYIRREQTAGDEDRYQTVYARCPGAVAAPTAGLHFSPELLAALDRQGVERAFVTLHVGAGTFQPVRQERLELHRMHQEWFSISPETAGLVNRARAEGRRVIAVGTTSLRALESAAGEDGTIRSGAAETDLFIAPGYSFRTIDALITNFHLPRSTLLMLVAALVGRERVLAAYRHAVAAGYRFFSYGDACFMERLS